MVAISKHAWTFVVFANVVTPGVKGMRSVSVTVQASSGAEARQIGRGVIETGLAGGESIYWISSRVDRNMTR